jgi:hypothetical protein
MTTKKYFVGLFIAALVLCHVSLSHAQPDPADQPKAMNPVAPMQFPGGPDWIRMTPEERRQAMQQFIEQTLRGSMTWLGYNDKTMQDEVVACAAEQEKLLEQVREKHRKVAQALMNKAPEKDVAVLLTDLRSSVEEMSKKRTAALATLDERIAFTQQPRLEAFLSMMGLVGNETSTIGGVAGSIMSTFGNLAMAQQANPPIPENAPEMPAPEGQQ